MSLIIKCNIESKSHSRPTVDYNFFVVLNFSLVFRKDNVFNMTGALSKKAHLKNSGVIREGATFKSFSEMVN